MKAKKIIGILFCIGGLLLSLHAISITGNVIGFSKVINPRLIFPFLVFLIGAFLLFTENLEAKAEQGEFVSLGKKGRAYALWARGSGLDELAEKIHEGKYKTIFLTQTSSIPLGIMLKEVYKTKYSGEKIPEYLTIDVKEIRRGRRKWKDSDENPINKRVKDLVKKTAKKMRSYGIGEGDKVLLLDEKFSSFDHDLLTTKDPYTGDYTPIETIKEKYKSSAKIGYNKGGTVGIAYRVINEAAEENQTRLGIDFDFISALGGGIFNEYRTLDDGRPSFRKGIAGWVHGLGQARRYSGKTEREISQQNIKLLKEIGRMSKDEAEEAWKESKYGKNK